jgi:hypothetical protein
MNGRSSSVASSPSKSRKRISRPRSGRGALRSARASSITTDVPEAPSLAPTKSGMSFVS